MRVDLIFDWDGTIARAVEYYDDAKCEFAAWLHRLHPALSAAELLARMNTIDHERMQVMGTDPRRFPGSMAATYRAVMAEAGRPALDALAAEAEAIGRTVFDAPYEPYAGVREMLLAYRAAGVRLALCTKGDPDIQYAKKIDRHGFRPLFDLIQVVPAKTPDVFRDVATRLQALRPAAEARPIVMVGDSRRDDIGPAQAAGLIGVWVEGQAFKHWKYEQSAGQDVVPHHAIAATIDLPTVVPLATVRLPGAPMTGVARSR